ncbi:hypothetical protein FB451DRAFT_1404685 [Mycena latifolia]|nr:hypothetical protein FB451DRAFT_1404685 [Mycena latifolia]
MESGWTRVNSSDLVDGVPFRDIVYNDWELNGWLAQANHIFNRLGITSNHKDYVLVDDIRYYLRLYDTGDSIPSGYLFLCPLADLQPDNSSYFRHPKCAAYWSLEPSGVERLGMEEAEQTGFPAFDFTMNVRACSWDESVYAGVRQFHQGKGFDPDSQDVARELGLPLYQVSTDLDGPFAHLEEVEDKWEDSEHEDIQLIHESPSEAMESNILQTWIHTFLIVKRPRFVEVAPASHRISARHCLHNVSEPQATEPPAPKPSVAEPPATPEESAPPSEPVPALEPDVVPAPESEGHVPPMLMTDSNPGAFTDEPEEMPAPISLPEPVPVMAEEPNPVSAAPAPEEPQPQRTVEEPAQEPAPPSTRPRASTSCPPCPCTRSRRRRPSETVVTVSAEEHTTAVSPYPYDLQPARDAPAGPVAEADVPEEGRAEVPQPRQWADEGGWDSGAIYMPRVGGGPCCCNRREIYFEYRGTFSGRRRGFDTGASADALVARV